MLTMATPDLFYISPALLAEAELVQPCNWGRIIRGLGARHFKFFREVLFESVRSASLGG